MPRTHRRLAYENLRRRNCKAKHPPTFNAAAIVWQCGKTRLTRDALGATLDQLANTLFLQRVSAPKEQPGCLDNDPRLTSFTSGEL
jgi:hypothetical protein